MDVFKIEQARQKAISDMNGYKKVCNHILWNEHLLETTKHEEYIKEKIKSLKLIKESYGFVYL